MQESGLYGAAVGLVVLIVVMAIDAATHLELVVLALRILSVG